PSDPDHITGIDVVAASLQHARLHPSRTVLVTGHTDTVGPALYNLKLSDRRARSVFFILTGLRDEWVKLSLESNATDDWRRILKWADQHFAFNCDPGDLDRVDAIATQRALANFRKNYDAEVDRIAATGDNPFRPLFTIKLGLGGPQPGPKTWGAF